jgi:hypothetical protein
MTVHVGQITSEVTVAGAPAPATEGEAPTVWAERCRIEAMVERLARDRLRTATGCGHD